MGRHSAPEEPTPKFTVHTCNPRNPGKPLPYGRKATTGTCERCDELYAGEPAREAPAFVRKAHAADRGYTQLSTHDCRKARCYVNGFGQTICTYGDW